MQQYKLKRTKKEKRIGYNKIRVIIKLDLIMSLKIPIKPLILVGPSGSGRSAIMLHLTMNFPHKFKKIISHTTRKPRPNEKDNNHFFFIDETKIKQMDANQ